jgi:hypothetical protein
VDEVKKCIRSMCDCRIPIKLKEYFYKAAIRLCSMVPNVGLLRNKMFIK